MYVNGERIEGRLLGVEEARRQYESIVTRMRDPALLEYIGKRMFRARIFPSEPRAEVRVMLSYTQVLRSENDLLGYRYPLRTEGSLPAPIDTVSVLIGIESRRPIKSMFRPFHKVAIYRKSEHRASASFEASHFLPERNFELLFSLGERGIGMTVLSYRASGADGFFSPALSRRLQPPAPTFSLSTSPSSSTPRAVCPERKWGRPEAR